MILDIPKAIIVIGQFFRELFAWLRRAGVAQRKAEKDRAVDSAIDAARGVPGGPVQQQRGPDAPP